MFRFMFMPITEDKSNRKYIFKLYLLKDHTHTFLPGKGKKKIRFFYSGSWRNIRAKEKGAIRIAKGTIKEEN